MCFRPFIQNFYKYSVCIEGRKPIIINICPIIINCRPCKKMYLWSSNVCKLNVSDIRPRSRLSLVNSAWASVSISWKLPQLYVTESGGVVRVRRQWDIMRCWECTVSEVQYVLIAAINLPRVIGATIIHRIQRNDPCTGKVLNKWPEHWDKYWTTRVFFNKVYSWNKC